MYFNMTFIEDDQAHPYRLRWSATELAKFRDSYTLKVVTASCSFSGAETLTEAMEQVSKWTAVERKHDPAAIALIDPEEDQ